MLVATASPVNNNNNPPSYIVAATTTTTATTSTGLYSGTDPTTNPNAPQILSDVKLICSQKKKVC